MFGTRPEIIKIAPVVRALSARGFSVDLLHTGQHYSSEMNSVIQKDLELPPITHNLQIGSGSHAVETSKALVGLEDLYVKLRPRMVLVQGDTNSTLAGALAATKMQIPVGHIEAGLRSFDTGMPEETNRVLTDHISELLFAPTDRSLHNLIREGIPSQKAFVTGNTVVDALAYISSKRPTGFGDEIRVPNLPQDYFLLTLHREQNVDDKAILQDMFEGINLAAKHFNIPVAFPAHPRTIKQIKGFNITLPNTFILMPSLGYHDFLEVERSAKLIFTDSGGVQEEACVLGVPCITLRSSTERPETLKIGANILAGHTRKAILHAAIIMINRKNRNSWIHPFGDGNASEKIVDLIARSKWM